MHCLSQVHNGRHLYGPGGMGEREYDPAPHLIGSEEIVETRDLPGFVEDGVTYQSHHFWIHFCRYARVKPLNPGEVERERRDSSVLIRIHHGGGWEVWRGDYMLAKALRRYGPDDRGAFLMCWFIWEAARSARDYGREESATEYRQAFVDGRLKKRKLPAQGKVKVWIEPATPKSEAA